MGKKVKGMSKKVNDVGKNVKGKLPEPDTVIGIKG